MSQPLADLYPGFEERTFKTQDASIYGRIGGTGSPLILLHGYPQTHVMWHKIVPELSNHFSLIIVDLRGYGRSSIPPTSHNHYSYSKRAMAQDVIEIMNALGHEKALVCGHDRGGRVAYRLALDFPDRVSRLAVLDIIPTYHMWHGITPKIAMSSFHWTFLAQPAPLPERMIGAAPLAWLENKLAAWSGAKNLSPFSSEALNHYRAFYNEPERLHATCEDYRAGATYDLRADEEDRAAKKKITCPTLALWGETGIASRAEAPLDLWRQWCEDVRGSAVACGHFLAEEAPDETLSHLLPFLKDTRSEP